MHVQVQHVSGRLTSSKGSFLKDYYMTDALNLGMLVCATIGSMAFGVLSAYGIFRLGFALMRPRTRALQVKTQPEVAV